MARRGRAARHRRRAIVAVFDRHQRLLDRARAPAPARAAARLRPRGGRDHPARRAGRGVDLDRALSRRIDRAAGRARRARGHLRAARGRRARVRGRAPASRRQPARGAAAARGARLQRAGGGHDAQDDGRLGQQRAPTRPGRHGGARARAHPTGDAALARRPRPARAGQPISQRVGALRRRRLRLAAGRGCVVRDASAHHLVCAARPGRDVGARVADVRGVALAGAGDERQRPAGARVLRLG